MRKCKSCSLEYMFLLLLLFSTKLCPTLCDLWTAACQAFIPSLLPRVCSDSCPLSLWRHLTISSSVIPFSCLQSFPASGSFPISQFFRSGDQSIGASALASVLPMNIQGWFPLGLTVWSPCCPRDSWESSPAPQFVSMNSLVLSLLYGPILSLIHSNSETLLYKLARVPYCVGIGCSVQFSSVAQLCLTLCDPMNRSTPGLPVHHQLPEFTQTHCHRVSDAIQPSHPRSSPSPPAPNPSQHQSLFQWVNSSHKVAKVLELQL